MWHGGPVRETALYIQLVTQPMAYQGVVNAPHCPTHAARVLVHPDWQTGLLTMYPQMSLCPWTSCFFFIVTNKDGRFRNKSVWSESNKYWH